MGAIFQSLGRTITAGVVLLIVLLIILVAAAGGRVALGDHGWWLFAMRWLHVTAGVMWIGLLWYFNFVQTPSMPKIPDEQKALGIVQVSPEEKAAAAKRAGMTSRINTMLSIPMLYFMVAQSHGGIAF